MSSRTAVFPAPGPPVSTTRRRSCAAAHSHVTIVLLPPAPHKLPELDSRHRSKRDEQRHDAICRRERAELENLLCRRNMVNSELQQHRPGYDPEQPKVGE